ncbi:hypothetical protein U1839_12335 [Sphingomonas sp. RT2P30]|uniref:hypothetical protein n=1 Tax=Parasphingomonas halimpatiens TaxID=3096162 RepID=UPI002FC7AC9E
MCDEWDLLTLALLKATVGNTNENFCNVILDKVQEKWVIRFRLFKQSQEDCEICSDISTEFFSYSGDFGLALDLDAISEDEITIGEGYIVPFDKNATTVFALKRN